MKYLIIVVSLVLASWGEAQTRPAQITTAQALALMQGQVDLIGDQFGSTEFQRGILQLAGSKKITVRVLTSVGSAANMKPLKAVGAKVFTINAKFTNSMVLVRGIKNLVIFPTRSKMNVYDDPVWTGQMVGLTANYWQVAKPY